MKSQLVSTLIVISQAVCMGAELPRSAAEAQGVSSKALLDFVESVDKEIDSLNSLMILRHGQVIAEGWWAPYHAEARHSLYSLSKSFTSTAVGLAVAEGKLSVDDPVLKFFPDEAPAEPSDRLKAMRVRDLLRMATGHETEPKFTPEVSWVKTFLAHPVPFKPGTHFLYNTPATYMQSAIVQKVTGQTVLDYLRPRLFEPLGIANPTWESSPQGISTGGYGLSVRTEDIASFGQLYLQKGKWQGKQLVPSAWVDEATSRQVSNGSNPASDWDQGYGYQFWRCRHGAYRGDGAFGQYCIVLPEQDAVIAITSGLKDMQAVMNLVWDKLLPAFQSSPLNTDRTAQSNLEQKLKSLSLKPQTGSSTPPQVLGRKYVFPPNDQKLQMIKLEPGEPDGDFILTARIDGAEHRTVCRKGAWHKGSTALNSASKQEVAASGAWTADDTYTVKFCFYETPFVVTTTLNFKDDELQYQTQANVGFGAKSDVKLIGITADPATAAKTAR
jgi:CubicO group peptidase (beta-lactamase class C family)